MSGSRCSPADPNQSALQLVLVGDDGPSSNSEVSVEPCVPKSTAVGLHAELQPAELLFLGDRLDFQAWAVGVGSDNRKSGLVGRPFSSEGKGDQARFVSMKKGRLDLNERMESVEVVEVRPPSEKVFACRAKLPFRVFLFQFRVSIGQKLEPDFFDGVEGRRRLFPTFTRQDSTSGRLEAMQTAADLFQELN